MAISASATAGGSGCIPVPITPESVPLMTPIGLAGLAAVLVLAAVRVFRSKR
ncbi:MAG: hypothetical protein AAGI11_00615 [Pseudomonadota bacterium]